MSTWATPEDVTTDVWPDAPATPATLADLLDAAEEQCTEYAPRLEAGMVVPVRYKLAVIAQARDIWTASRRNADDTMGPDGFTITVPPLSAHVRNLLRPRTPRVQFTAPTVTP